MSRILSALSWLKGKLMGPLAVATIIVIVWLWFTKPVLLLGISLLILVAALATLKAAF